MVAQKAAFCHVLSEEFVARCTAECVSLLHTIVGDRLSTTLGLVDWLHAWIQLLCWCSLSAQPMPDKTLLVVEETLFNPAVHEVLGEPIAAGAACRVLLPALVVAGNRKRALVIPAVA